jgi:plastocyanin
MISLRRPVILAFVAAYAFACGGDDTTTTPPTDAGVDSPSHPIDANLPPPVDANTPVDANHPVDANSPVDANMPVDAGVDAPPLVCDGGVTNRMVTVAPNGTLTFSPDTLTICRGDTVTWMWGSDSHTVTSGTGCTPDNQFCSPNDTNCATAATSITGATYSHTFPAAGTFPYFCRPHCGSGMTGSIVVQ